MHDAARPCLSLQLLGSLLRELKGDQVGGLLAVPAKDTLKASNAEHRVLATIDRSTIWQAQTPQMFRYGLLKNALSNAIRDGINITDEASAMESDGHQPRLIKGDARNIKITTPDDLALAEFLLGPKF